MIEKAVEHNTEIFLFFIDLWKAFDSVPYQALRSAPQVNAVDDSLQLSMMV